MKFNLHALIDPVTKRVVAFAIPSKTNFDITTVPTKFFPNIEEFDVEAKKMGAVRELRSGLNG